MTAYINWRRSASLQHPPEPIQSPWRWRQYVPSKFRSI